MSKNVFGQVVLLIVSLSIFTLAFSEVSILEVSKISFFVLLSVSALFVAWAVIQSLHTKEKVTSPPVDITFFPNLNIISPPLRKSKMPSEKAKNIPVSQSSENSKGSDVSSASTPSSLVSEPPELIAKVIKAWYQDDE